MMIVKDLTIFLFLILLTACNRGKVTSGVGSIHCDTITITNRISEVRPASQLLDSVEFVKLETLPNCLIEEVKRVYFANDRFYIHDNNANLFCFDSSGSFLFKIGNNGRGPGEFSSCDQVVLKEKENAVWVTDLQLRKVLKYDLSDTLLKDQSYHFFSHANFPLALEKHCFYIGTRSNPNKSYDNHMIVITNEDFDFEKAYLPIKSQLTKIAYVESHDGYFYKDSLSVKPIFQNVIYRIDENGIHQRYFLDFKNDEFISETDLLKVAKDGYSRGLVFRLSETGKVYTIDFLLESDSFLFFIYNKEGRSVSNYYSKRSKTLYSQRGFNDDVDSGIAYQFPIGLAGEKFIFSLPVYQLFDENSNSIQRKGEIYGNKSLSELKRSSTINDNPILIIAKFKNL